MGSPVVHDPKICLLGLLPDAEVDKYQATFLYETLFSTKSCGQAMDAGITPHNPELEKRYQ